FRSAAANDKKDLPRTVSEINLINQNAPVPLTTLFTANEDGMYRVSAYMVVTNSDTNGTGAIQGVFNFTDDTGTVQGNFNPRNNECSESCAGGNAFVTIAGNSGIPGYQTGQWVSTHFVIRAKAETPITFQILPLTSLSLGNAQYSVFVKVEKL